MGKVRWTDKSVKNLKSIHDYISKDSIVYASRFTTSLIKFTEKLNNFPKSGRIVPELENLLIRELIYKNYRIVYRLLDEDTVEILIVTHGSKEINISNNK